jgi:hypothetical protein
MTLAARFGELAQAYRELEEVAGDWRIQVVEDHPLWGEPAVVDWLEDRATQFLALIEEGSEAAVRGAYALEAPPDLQRAAAELVAAQEHFNQLSRAYADGLASYARVDELVRIGRERGGEWALWSATVRHALDSCQHRVFQLADVLLECWRELVDRTERAGVHVNASAVGQRLTDAVPAERSRQGVD